MTPEEFEPIVRAKIKERIDQGWIITQGVTRERREVDGVVCACALGCVVEGSEPLKNVARAAAAAGISDSNAATDFVSGFDCTRPRWYDFDYSWRDHDPAWYYLGRRMWVYAQELMAQRDAEKEST